MGIDAENRCCSLFNTDWTQPLEGVAGLAETGLSIIGCATGDWMLAGAAGTAALTNVMALGRLACLGDVIQLNNSVEHLHRTAQQLRDEQAAKDAEISQLTMFANAFQVQNEQMKMQLADALGQKERALRNIARQTEQINYMQTQYRSLEDECRKIQESICDTAAAGATAGDDVLHETVFIGEAGHRISEQVDRFREGAEKTAQENDRMKQQLEEYRSTIDGLQSEKTGLVQQLARAEWTQGELQRQIDQNTVQLDRMHQRLQEFGLAIAPAMR